MGALTAGLGVAILVIAWVAHRWAREGARELAGMTDIRERINARMSISMLHLYTVMLVIAAGIAFLIAAYAIAVGR